VLTLFVIPAVYSYFSQEHKPAPDETNKPMSEKKMALAEV
jgi:hypothetical protein